jgi:hypothetical protein
LIQVGIFVCEFLDQLGTDHILASQPDINIQGAGLFLHFKRL